MSGTSLAIEVMRDYADDRHRWERFAKAIAEALETPVAPGGANGLYLAEDVLSRARELAASERTPPTRQLWLVESGEYSDFQYVPLSMPPDFDIQKAARAFRDSVPRDAKHYSLTDAHRLSGFLCAQFGGRDPEIGEVMRYAGTVMDPIHYGSWAADKAFPWDSVE